MPLMMLRTVTGSLDQSSLIYTPHPKLLYSLSNVSVKGHDPVTAATARFTAAHQFPVCTEVCASQTKTAPARSDGLVLQGTETKRLRYDHHALGLFFIPFSSQEKYYDYSELRELRNSDTATENKSMLFICTPWPCFWDPQLHLKIWLHVILMVPFTHSIYYK